MRIDACRTDQTITVELFVTSNVTVRLYKIIKYQKGNNDPERNEDACLRPGWIGAVNDELEKFRFAFYGAPDP